MEILERRDSFLNEAIAALDTKFEQSGFNEAEALASLTGAEREWKDSEIERCVLDRRYYLENYHIIKEVNEDTGAARLKTLYPFWESQEIFYTVVDEMESNGEPVKIIVLKARQLGLSTLNQGVIFHDTIFSGLVNTLIVAQDPDQADYLAGMSRLAYERLPWWMRPEQRYGAKGRYLIFDRKDPLERMASPGLESNVYIEAANKISGVAVGKTLLRAHLSELSLWPDPALLTKMIWPALPDVPGLYSVMESTARGRQHWWYSLWKQAEAGKLGYRPVFIPFYSVKKYAIPLTAGEVFTRTPEEQALVDRVLREEKFLITDATLKWRRAKIENFAATENGNEWGFYGEYPSNPEEAFQATGICAFNKKKLHSLYELTCHDPRWVGEITLQQDERTLQFLPKVKLSALKPRPKNLPSRETYGGRLHIWEFARSNETYQIGGDVAGGQGGGDFSVVQVLRKGKGIKPDVQVAEWRGWINPGPFAVVLAAMGYLYNNAQIACEVNGEVGGRTNTELFRVLEYPNIYQWMWDDKIKNMMSDYFGWVTNSKTRPLIISKMREAIDDLTLLIQSKECVDEMFDFAADAPGQRFQAQGVAHDDLTMGLMITYYTAHQLDWTNSPEAPRVHPANDHPGSDFYNTDYSPFHDDPQGARQQLYQQGKVSPNEMQLKDLGVYSEADSKGADWRSL